MLIPIRDDNHWHELRGQHVGSTETPALFGMHRNKSPFELYHEKKGALPAPDFSDNERVTWGVFLEPAIARGVAHQHGLEVSEFKVYGQSDTCQRMGSSFDWRVLRHPTRKGEGILEIKNMDYLEFQKHEDGPPLYYQLQVQQELECGGFDWGILAILVGGNALQTYEYDRRPGTIAKMIEAINLFWDRLDRNDPPPVSWEQDYEVISHLYKDAGAGWSNFSGDERVRALCKEYNDAMALEKAAETRKKAAKAELLTIIGASDKVTCDDWTISAGMTKDVEIEAYTRTGYRNFRVTRKGGKGE